VDGLLISDEVAASVASLLQSSRQAHARYRQALVDRQVAEARTAMQLANDTRIEADAADSNHEAPAWQEPDNYADQHAELLRFYAAMLSR
jgi:hypothetical protein